MFYPSLSCYLTDFYVLFLLQMTILNRPIIILKGEFGFLGLKNSKIEANRPTYDAFELDQADNGLYTFKGQRNT